MKEKINKKSFAQRAKEITNRYKRAKFDKTEREELDAALAALAQEQEAYKQANGIGEYSPENIQAQQMEQMEGMQQFPWGGNLSQAVNPNAFAPINIPKNYGISVMGNTRIDLSKAVDPNAFSPIGIPKNYGIPVTGNAPQTTLGSTQGMLPSLIGGAASMVGNMIMSAGTKPMELKSSYAPEQISLARQRERLSREAGTAQNVTMRGLRESGSRGSYLSNVGTAIAGINSNLSDDLTQSYMNEEMTNLEQRNRAQDYRKNIDMANWQARQQAVNDKRAYQSAAISTIPSAMTDINRIQGQNALLESLGSQNYMIAPSTNKAWKDKLLGRTLYGTVRK